MHNFKIKGKRWGHVVVLAAVLLLMSIVCWAFFLKEDPIPWNGAGMIILIIIGGVGSVCLFMAVKMLISNPNVILINEEGFEYNPGGVSSGFMHWDNVAELKLVEVRTQQGELNGPIWEQTLAVKFKDPSLYQKQFNPLMRGLMNLNKNMYDADMFFRLSSFGKQAEEVHTLMLTYWNARKNEWHNEKTNPI